MELSPGEMLGPYRLIERAGVGGMAEVWKAYQPSLERFVAIKILPRHYAEQPGYLERFRREVLAISRLEHPNILTIHDAGEQDGFTYMVTQFVTGGTLARWLGRPWSVGEAMRVLQPLASALDYSHRQGVIHRDVKPSNVLLTDQGLVVLGDFGVARMTEGSSELTQVGAVIGTPAYMAPEQGLGEPAGPASDRYSLGIIAYELLTGRAPFQAETPMAVAMAHVHRPLPPARTINPGVSEAVEAVLYKALAKDPADRYPSAQALVQALVSAASGPVSEPGLVQNPASAPASPPPGGPLREHAWPTPGSGEARQPAPRPRGPLTRRRLLVAGGAVVGGVGLVTLVRGVAGSLDPPSRSTATATSVPTIGLVPPAIRLTEAAAARPTEPPRPTPAPTPTAAPLLTPTAAPMPTPTALGAVQGRNYADELTDFSVSPQSVLQTQVGSPTPLEIPGGKVVQTAGVARLIQSGMPFVLIDALNDQGHRTLPGAVRIEQAGSPGTFTDAIQTELSSKLRAQTQGNLGATIVFFCRGARCWESYNACLRAMALGYTNVYWYRGGVDAWQEAGLPFAS